MPMTLMVMTCSSCGHRSLPPRYACPQCLGDSLAPTPISSKGSIYSHTTIYVAPEHFDDEAPYTIILVELDEGPRVTARLAAGEPIIGKAVELSAYSAGVYWFSLVAEIGNEAD